MYKVVHSEIVPYVAKELNYFEVTKICFKTDYSTQLIYETPNYQAIKDFLAPFNLTLSGIVANGVSGEPDIVIYPINNTNGFVQFGQIKYRTNFEDLRAEIIKSPKYYNDTDWCIYITSDQMLIEHKIYDKPSDYVNRKVVDVIRYQQPIYPELRNSLQRFPQIENDKAINYINENIKRHSEYLKIKAEAIKQSKKASQSINIDYSQSKKAFQSINLDSFINKAQEITEMEKRESEKRITNLNNKKERLKIESINKNNQLEKIKQMNQIDNPMVEENKRKLTDEINIINMKKEVNKNIKKFYFDNSSVDNKNLSVDTSSCIQPSSINNSSINNSSIDTSPCIKPSSIKNK